MELYNTYPFLPRFLLTTEIVAVAVRAALVAAAEIPQGERAPLVRRHGTLPLDPV